MSFLLRMIYNHSDGCISATRYETVVKNKRPTPSMCSSAIISIIYYASVQSMTVCLTFEFFLFTKCRFEAVVINNGLLIPRHLQIIPFISILLKFMQIDRFLIWKDSTLLRESSDLRRAEFMARFGFLVSTADTGTGFREATLHHRAKCAVPVHPSAPPSPHRQFTKSTVSAVNS